MFSEVYIQTIDSEKATFSLVYNAVCDKSRSYILCIEENHKIYVIEKINAYFLYKLLNRNNDRNRLLYMYVIKEKYVLFYLLSPNTIFYVHKWIECLSLFKCACIHKVTI